MNEYLDLLQQYLNAPSGPSDDLADALEKAEQRILENPPAGKGRGLLEFSPLSSPSFAGLGDLFDVCRAPPLSDVIETIPETDWPEWIAARDAARLRPFVLDVLNQSSAGSCGSEGAAGCVMCRRAIKGMRRIKLNPYFAYGRVNGGVDRGSTLSDNLAFFQKYGCASQDVWSRSKGWRTEPSDAAYEDAARHRILKIARVRNKLEFGTALVKGIGPVYFGYSGHAIFGCDPIDRLRFRYTNSWSPSWGDNGFGTLSYNSIYWGYGAWAILSVTTPDDEV